MPSKSIYEPTAVRSDAATGSEQPKNIIPLSAVEEPKVSEEPTSEHENIARVAYSRWQERGCPEGSPEEDWLQAEQEVHLRKLAKQVGRETDTLGSNQTMAKSA